MRTTVWSALALSRTWPRCLNRARGNMRTRIWGALALSARGWPFGLKSGGVAGGRYPVGARSFLHSELRKVSSWAFSVGVSSKKRRVTWLASP